MSDSILETIQTPVAIVTPTADDLRVGRGHGDGGAPAPDAGFVIEARGLSKRFNIYPKPWGRAVEWITRGRVLRHDEFWALRGIDLQVRRGECVGIIGPNGSGKSTLLKVLTGSLHATLGDFRVQGRVLSLLELGAGLNVELTGRQNVINSSQLLAFPPGYAAGRMPAIQDFAELGDFFDRPVKFYSSGMVVRLAFSMFACFDPDVFIIDEALSVGDVRFQQKCFTRLREILARGTTLLFVSHDTQAVQNLCGRVLVLHKGTPFFMGKPDEAVSRYHAVMGHTPGSMGKAPAPPIKAGVDTDNALKRFIREHNILSTARNRHGQRGHEIVAACATDKDYLPTTAITMFETFRALVLLHANVDTAAPTVGIQIYDRLNNLLFAAGTWQLRFPLPPLAAGDELVVELSIQCNMSPGQYVFSLSCSEPHPEHADLGTWHDCHEGLGPLEIGWRQSGTMPFYGIAQLPMEARVLRGMADALPSP